MGCLRSAEGLPFNIAGHFFAIVFTATSFVLLMMVAFYNAPLDHVKSTLEAKAAQRMFLLTINETSNTVVFDRRDHTHISEDYIERRQGGIMPGRIGLAAAAYKPEDKNSHSNDEWDSHTNDNWARRAENETTIVGTGIEKRDTEIEERGGNGIHAYGFGIWGWCEWDNKNWLGNARCTKSAFWTLPRSCQPGWDNIQQVINNFPKTVTHALSAVGFILVFAPFLVLSFLILLIIAIRFPGPYPPLSVPPKSEWPKEALNTKTKVAWILRDWRTHIIYTLLMMILLMPTIVVVLIARNEVQDGTRDRAIGGSLVASPGTGFVV
ncbi:hypothetical protein I317_01911 [Kwoniella heveanensis CBS 569]|nr:hypothetical protein I317_01911 [Kwoniella heveanensis CBS 569]